METRVFSAFHSPPFVGCFVLRRQGMSNSCFYSFRRSVKGGLRCLTAGHTQPARRVARSRVSRWAGAQAAAAGDSAGPRHAPGSQEPGPPGTLRKGDKQTCKAAFLFPDLKLKKKKKNHLEEIFPQREQHKNTKFNVG